MAHDDGRNATPGGAVEAVHIAATDAAGLNAHQYFERPGLRHGKIGKLKMAVLGKNK